ncbi:MAG: type I DNA topoisomerase [Maricaulis sp.]|uniref:type I DNA topoisomerase n=1 Tax=Maricaulis sp. TaxID=1486257 RepID=UPI001B1B620C|nr:type I DNA topoisomerase [Maricaulis sp.]MBO6728743.1 type I DNA topoisomerase [Maricaulis sp.]MBO6847820.1 type I DNA topoisomerase [Maricaulis sp.]MBO6877443.1 type I DNA topoisomerase [Maricaulis sp.]
MNVVVVESPAKAKTINKYLGSQYTVLASFGHVRDLPPKDGSVKPDEDFEMAWEVDSQSAKRVKAIADAVKESDKLILATDPDREGEAISWHLLEALTKRRVLKNVTVERVAFNAITKPAIQEAMRHPRAVDMELVNAYLARRALDYLVGFTLSPVLWRKLPGSRSAGRVQSVALRLICDRELEIEKFKAEEYWTVDADIATGGNSFRAKLVTLDGKKLQKLSIKDRASANAAVDAINAANLSISRIEAKPTRRNPPPPFTTSTLQQEAARKLGFSATRTMQTAQKLYEGVNIGGETVGLITYMRTDGVSMVPEAINQARDVIGDQHGSLYVPASPRMYSSKAKNAQEAHEAIRPTSFSRLPENMDLDGDMARLYQLIWRRAVASQMESARFERTTIDVTSSDGKTGLRATGSVLMFDGFLTLYQEGRDDEEDEGEARLPKVEQGAAAEAAKTYSDQHFTQPPPRFTEASLVKRMEELGIGRPSTYASTLQVLRDRDYVRMDKNRFHPEDKGRVVIAFLENFFSRYVEYDFTADLEGQLDKVSAGDLDWKQLLRDFWTHFKAAVEEIGELRITNVLDALNEALAPHIFPEKEDGSDPRLCPSCNEGTLSLRLGKFGAFLGCSNHPDCKFTRQMSPQDADSVIEGDGQIAIDPDSGKPITLKDGRFGLYLEMELEGEDKPKRASIPKGWDPHALTEDQAIKLMSLPRLVGEHPDDGQPITAAIGRYGPYVHHEKTYANLANVEEVFEIGLNRAVSVIADKRANPGRRGSTATALKDLGEHDGKPVRIMSGRYGPYVKYEKINATLPKGTEPESVTLEQAMELVEAKAAKGGKKKPATKKKPAAKKTTAKKKAPAKKTTAKKTTKKADSES